MKTTEVLLGASLSLLAGCANAPTTPEHGGLYVKPALIMLTADEAEARGLGTASTTASPAPIAPPGAEATQTTAVLVPPAVKAYTVNRSVDAADPNLLHEEHVVYRRETTPTWRLQAPASQKILVGPRMTDGREELQPILSKELTVFLIEQRQAAEVNQKAIAALFRAVDGLSQAVAARPANAGADALDKPRTDGTSAKTVPDQSPGTGKKDLTTPESTD